MWRWSPDKVEWYPTTSQDACFWRFPAQYLELLRFVAKVDLGASCCKPRLSGVNIADYLSNYLSLLSLSSLSLPLPPSLSLSLSLSRSLSLSLGLVS